MKYSETLVLWNDDPQCIALHRLQQSGDYFPRLTYSGGAAYIDVRRMRGDRLVARMLSDAWNLVQVYGLPAADVHRAFAHVDEYAALWPGRPEGFRQLERDMAVVVVPGRLLEYRRLPKVAGGAREAS